jgi:hypothetical protein
VSEGRAICWAFRHTWLEPGDAVLVDSARREDDVYVSGMTGGTLARSYGKVFNAVAVEYDRNRPTYPEVLVDRACELAVVLEPGVDELHIARVFHVSSAKVIS